jgi:cytochrome P450
VRVPSFAPREHGLPVRELGFFELSHSAMPAGIESKARRQLGVSPQPANQLGHAARRIELALQKRSVYGTGPPARRSRIEAFARVRKLAMALPTRNDFSPGPLDPYRPPAPVPRDRPLGAIALIRALWRNPLECWTQEHFERPIVKVNLPIAEAVLVHEPTAIRRVLLDNTVNYRKDALQRRVLSAGLQDGLLSAEGERWHIQRRTLAPLFARRTVMNSTPAMMVAAEALVNRWPPCGGEAVIDVAADMTRVTLDVLERTIFSDRLSRDAEQFRIAMSTYFDTIGRIDVFDLFNIPDAMPRIARLRVRPTLRFFEAAIDEIIATRRGRPARHPAKNDILTLLLDALDPATGERMTPAEVRSNILTFIAAGHETTANAKLVAVPVVPIAPVAGSSSGRSGP